MTDIMTNNSYLQHTYVPTSQTKAISRNQAHDGRKQPTGITFCERRRYNELSKGWTAARIQLYAYLSHIVHYIA